MKTLRYTACVITGLLLVLTGLPLRSEGKDIPGIIIINKLQNRFGPVTFDHKKHTGFAENCGTCHHTHTKKTYATCNGCHTRVPEIFRASANHMFMACSECHSDYSPTKPEMPGLKTALHKTCFSCHVGIGELGSSPAACGQTCHTRK